MKQSTELEVALVIPTGNEEQQREMFQLEMYGKPKKRRKMKEII